MQGAFTVQKGHINCTVAQKEAQKKRRDPPSPF